MPRGRNGDRDAAIWDAWCRGITQPTIATRFSLSNQRVSQIVAEFRAALPPEDKAERVQRAIAQLEWVGEELAVLASSVALPAYSNGRPILTGEIDPETGEEKVALDHSQRITAMRELRATQESLRKLLGTDAKVETSVTVDTTDEVAALLARARAAREAEG